MNSNFISNIFKIKTEKDFKTLVYKAYDYQVKYNPVYNEYSRLILKDAYPSSIHEIPFLPISLFKSKRIICCSKKEAAIFKSSGTTNKKSTHYIYDIELYKKSFISAFNLFYGNISNYCLIALLPNYLKQKNSSLVYMTKELIKLTKNLNSGFYLDDLKLLSERIKYLEHKKVKTIILGTTKSLLNLATQFPLKLKNTIIMETGGSKGGEKEYIKEELYEIFKSSFSIKEIHSEYGMTELLSQSYSKKGGIFESPPWKKIFIRDIYDPLKLLENSRSGGINIIDLANIYSCPFIATDDLGKKINSQQFNVIGRIENSDLRGCNMLSQ